MQKPPYGFVATSLELIGELDDIKRNCTEAFDSSSPASAENSVANRSGIDPKLDFVSIPGVRLHLHLKLYAAREHLLSCIYLIGSNAERTLVNLDPKPGSERAGGCCNLFVAMQQPDHLGRTPSKVQPTSPQICPHQSEGGRDRSQQPSRSFNSGGEHRPHHGRVRHSHQGGQRPRMAVQEGQERRQDSGDQKMGRRVAYSL